MLSIDGGKSPRKNVMVVMGPMPAEVAGSAIEQMEEQGWRARFVLFAGMMEHRIALGPHPQLIPVYKILADKLCIDGAIPEPPKFNFGPQG